MHNVKCKTYIVFLYKMASTSYTIRQRRFQDREMERQWREYVRVELPYKEKDLLLALRRVDYWSGRIQEIPLYESGGRYDELNELWASLFANLQYAYHTANEIMGLDTLHGDIAEARVGHAATNAEHIRDLYFPRGLPRQIEPNDIDLEFIS